jgi:hypothetical protein
MSTCILIYTYIDIFTSLQTDLEVAVGNALPVDVRQGGDHVGGVEAVTGGRVGGGRKECVLSVEGEMGQVSQAAVEWGVGGVRLRKGEGFVDEWPRQSVLSGIGLPVSHTQHTHRASSARKPPACVLA